jgi:hypothetical protein
MIYSERVKVFAAPIFFSQTWEASVGDYLKRLRKTGMTEHRYTLLELICRLS